MEQQSVAAFADSRSGGLRRDNDVFCESLEPLTICLHHGNGNMAGLPGLNIPYGPRFVHMRASYDFAVGAVL